jgi:hypothetical protein
LITSLSIHTSGDTDCIPHLYDKNPYSLLHNIAKQGDKCLISLKLTIRISSCEALKLKVHIQSSEALKVAMHLNQANFLAQLHYMQLS